MLNITDKSIIPKGLGVNNSGLSEDERKAIKALADIIEQMMALRPNMPIHQFVFLLRLALDEGHSQKYYAEKLGYAPSTVSRAVLDLGRKTRRGEEGLMLLEDRPSAHDLRLQELSLSARGMSLLRKFVKKLYSAVGDE